MDRPSEEIHHVEDAVWVLHAAAGVQAIARVGAIADYDQYHFRWLEDGVRLIHSPDEHRRASELSAWYPLLADITPKSIWGREPPRHMRAS